MSNYTNTRRAPNVSQYLHGLNTIPAPGQQDPNNLPTDIAHIGDDLDFLAHADFFDFDSFNPAAANNVDHHAAANYPAPHPDHKRPVNGPNYQFSEFQTYPSTVSSSPTSANPLQGHYPPQPTHNLPFASAPQPGEKRKSSVANSLPSAADLEEQSRMAAEEDKRRRNTAASARFRIKKKQREQALEKQAKEMSDKVSQLEGKVQQLEMENKWLKGLITEKSDGSGSGGTDAGAAPPAMKESDERKTDDDAKGVGTTGVEIGEEDEDEA